MARPPTIGGMVRGSVALSGACGALTGLAFGPLLPAMAADLDVSVALLGQAPAAAMLLAALLGLLIGPLADHVGQRLMLTLGLATLAISALAVAVAPGYLLVLVAALVGAPGRASAIPVAQAVVGTHFAGLARHRALAGLQAGISVGVVLGMPLVTIVESFLGWRAAFVIIGVVALAAAGLVARAVPPHSARPTAPFRLGAVLGAYAPLLRHRPTVGLIAATLVGHTGLFVLFTYAGAFYVQVHGFTSQQVGWAFGSTGVGFLVGSSVASRWDARLPARPTIVGALLVRGVAMSAALLLPVGPLVSVLLFAAMGFVDGFYILAVVTELTNATPAGRGTTMVLNGSANALGTALGGALGGLLLVLGGFSLLGLSLPFFAAGAALLVWWSGRAPRVLPGALRREEEYRVSG